MIALSAEKIRADLVEGLRGVGYRGDLLAENYRFPDYFDPNTVEREVVAAAFSQTPISYDSVNIGVAESNGVSGVDLIDRLRGLGAPTILEINGERVREWAVSRNEGEHGLIGDYHATELRQLFAKRAPVWDPQEFLRAKNIGKFHWSEQLNLFAGLLPELEDQIQEKLEPLLHEALSETTEVYRMTVDHKPDSAQLFQLIFWLLTAKVFRDRGVAKFAQFTADSHADEILAAVATQQQRPLPRLLNQTARQVAATRIWRSMDFRNLSVEVLSQVWSRILVDKVIKKKLGIHRTSRTIVRYIVERIPFKQSGNDRLIVLEPCCGSAVFLIGAMNELRHKLFGMPPAERHAYFTKRLVGIDKEAFSVEISRLALTLADFPNPDGWKVDQGDVFDEKSLPSLLNRAGVVLCNPPWEDIEKEDRSNYRLGSVLKPAELLHRVLRDLHPSGVLGFVLPRGFVDRAGYADVRRKIAERFATVEITLLPDRAFDEAEHESAVLIAKDPFPHDRCCVITRTVNEDEASWMAFTHSHTVFSEGTREITSEEAAASFLVPELAEVWDLLQDCPVLGECASLHRGIEWNEPLTIEGKETGNRERFVRNKTDVQGFVLGVPPQTKFDVFQRPALRYLDLREEHQRGTAYTREWDKPKVIVNKARRSRGAWRMAAFADEVGIACYQTFIAAWPKDCPFDVKVLAAIINGPLANAFVATREKRDITIETLRQLPLPRLSASQCNRIAKMVGKYEPLIDHPFTSNQADRLLREIDAAILDGYHLPPRIEHSLLEFFRGSQRSTPFNFGPYLPQGEDVFFSLSERLSPQFRQATAGALLERMGIR